MQQATTDTHQGLLGIRVPLLSSNREIKIPNDETVQFFVGNNGGCNFPMHAIHSITTLATRVRIAKSLSSVKEPEHTMNTMITLFSTLETCP